MPNSKLERAKNVDHREPNVGSCLSVSSMRKYMLDKAFGIAQESERQAWHLCILLLFMPMRLTHEGLSLKLLERG
jgi:hypothetical protein